MELDLVPHQSHSRDGMQTLRQFIFGRMIPGGSQRFHMGQLRQLSLNHLIDRAE